LTEGKDLIRATLALIRYLADTRFKLSRWLNAENTSDSESQILYSLPREADVELEPETDLEFAAELVDTTLFRAYMFCRPQLVGPLVRRPNRCLPNVVEEMLEHAHVRTFSADLIVEIPRLGGVFSREGSTSPGAAVVTNVRTEGGGRRLSCLGGEFTGARTHCAVLAEVEG
jgi:Vacuolar sorting protein 39 domain 1